MHIPQDVVRHPLYVITAIFNPIRFKSRWKLYRDFQHRVRSQGGILVTIEAAFGEREFALEEHAAAAAATGEQPGYKSFGPAPILPSAIMPASRLAQDYIKVRAGQGSEIWLKENLLNIAVQHLPEDAKYVAFVDADVQFTRPDWISETLHALQHFDVVQMFSNAIQLDAAYEPMSASYGFGFCHQRGVPRGRERNHYLPGGVGGVPNAWHTGFAWAWRRSALNAVGGLLEHGILGSGDNHMARALVGRANESLNPKLSANYRQVVKHWERRALEHIKQNVGYIDGTIYHFYHGRLFNRRYRDRWKILIEHKFDPHTDLKKDWRGLLALTDKKPMLRDDIRRYFRARSEDSIDVYPGDGRLLGPSPATW